ncbi:allophanate hydrolase [Paenarthrobacter sp. NPDC089675]|uniref:allophanate hydrolase n=1 Tax=Paenarthrobacter sp. NPDC089675 TaxID=3364376 RepID=UPI0038122770
MSAIVMDPGTQTVVVPPDVALDRASMQLANALLGNPLEASGLEILVGGLKLRFVTGSAFAVSGAEGLVRLNGSEITMNKAVRVAPGGVLEFGQALFGLRYYLAVQGGVEPQPEPLRTGRTLAFGRPHGQGFPLVKQPPRRALDSGRPVVARVAPGPDVERFDAGTWLRLTKEPWTLSPESDRAGARLAGRPLMVAAQATPARPLVPGAVLLPPSGLPLIALAGHPESSRSPVVAVVRDEDLDALGQARPGQMVHLLG